MGMAGDGTAEGVELQLGTGREGLWGSGGKRTEEGADSGGREDREKGRALGGGTGRGCALLREGPEEGVAFGEGPEKAGGP